MTQIMTLRELVVEIAMTVKRTLVMVSRMRNVVNSMVGHFREGTIYFIYIFHEEDEGDIYTFTILTPFISWISEISQGINY